MKTKYNKYNVQNARAKKEAVRQQTKTKTTKAKHI